MQWSDPTNKREPRVAKKTLAAEFTRPAAGLAFTVLPDPDTYAPQTGFVDGFPAGRDASGTTAWGVHCYGVIGVGRDNAADSGGGTELYVVIGHAPRQLDRNITVLGRVAQVVAEYDSPLIVPTSRSLVMTAARETVQAAYVSAGRLDAYNEESVYYLTDEQFGFVAAVSGTMVRDKPAACFYFGQFFAESLHRALDVGGDAFVAVFGRVHADHDQPVLRIALVPFLDVRHRAERRCEREGELAVHHVQQHRRRALVGDVLELHPGHALQQRDAHVPDRAAARRAVLHLPGPRAGQRDQAAHVPHRHRRMHRHQ